MTIHSTKDNKMDIYETGCTDEKEIARLVMTFKPKRGYKVVKFKIEREWWLV